MKTHSNNRFRIVCIFLLSLLIKGSLYAQSNFQSDAFYKAAREAKIAAAKVTCLDQKNALLEFARECERYADAYEKRNYNYPRPELRAWNCPEGNSGTSQSRNNGGSNTNSSNQNYPNSSSASSNAALQNAIDALAPFMESMLNTKHESLKQTDNIFLLSGGYKHLLSPFVGSNRTNKINENIASWYVNTGSLNKKGLSFFVDAELLELNTPNYTFNGVSTSGNRVNFTGTLKASAVAVAASLGKDLRSKNNKSHLYIGPTVSYLGLTDHVFKYGTGLAKEFRQDGMKEDQFQWGIDAKYFLFLTNGVGLNASYGFRLPVKEVDKSVNYYPSGFTYAHIGLVIRLSL
jgi:hypothetical protein